MIDDAPKGRPRKIPQLLLERLALGEVTSEEERELRGALAQQPGGEERLADLERSNTKLLGAHPPAQQARAIELGLHRARVVSGIKDARDGRWPGLFRLAAVGVPALAVIVLAIWLLPSGAVDETIPGPGDEIGTRVKGPARLEVHRLVDGVPQELEDLDVVSHGDVLQLSYFAGPQRYGVVLSIDGNDAVTLHFPETVDDPNTLKGGGRVLLPHGYRLDDAPEYERFFLVTSVSPFSTATVMEAVRELAGDTRRIADDPLELAEDLEQTSLLLRKANP